MTDFRRMMGAVGTALAGVVVPGVAVDNQPPAELTLVRRMLEELRLLGQGSDDAATVRALRRFQARVGLKADGFAGPATVHKLVQACRDARELRWMGVAV